MLRWRPSSAACASPYPASAGSLGIPVGVGILAVYVPVAGSTIQFERNLGKSVSIYKVQTMRENLRRGG